MFHIVLSADVLPYCVVVVYPPLCPSFIKWPSVCFLLFDTFGTGRPDPLFQMFTVIVMGYLQQAHCSIHFPVLENNKQTAKRMAAKSGKTETVILITSAAAAAAPTVPSLSLFLSICVFWLCMSVCMHVHCESAAACCFLCCGAHVAVHKLWPGVLHNYTFYANKRLTKQKPIPSFSGGSWV